LLQVPAVALVVMALGHDAYCGFSLSSTVMVNEQVATLFDVSVAVKVTVFTPRLKFVPELPPAVLVTTGVLQLSVAVAAE
jgi:hypothetical protein